MELALEKFDYDDDNLDLALMLTTLKNRFYPTYEIIINILKPENCDNCNNITVYYPKFDYKIYSGNIENIECPDCACDCVTDENFDFELYCDCCQKWCCRYCSRNCVCDER